MKSVTTLFLLLIAFSSVATASDAREIDRTRRQFVQAFNSRDMEALDAGFALTADWIKADGDIYRGKAEIMIALESMIDQYPDVSIRLTATSVRFIDSKTVIEDGRSMFTDGPASSALRYVVILAKDGDQWKVISIRDIPVLSD